MPLPAAQPFDRRAHAVLCLDYYEAMRQRADTPAEAGRADQGVTAWALILDEIEAAEAARP